MTSPDVDVLSEMVAGMALVGAVQCRAEFSGPWGLAFAPRQAMRFHLLEAGAATLSVPGRPPLELRAGDFALCEPGSAHDVTDAPGRPPRHTVLGLPIGAPVRHVAFGEGPVDTVLICGSLQIADGSRHPLLDLLPPVLRVRPDDHDTAGLQTTLSLLAEETRRTRAGGPASVQRLVELVFLQLLRAWLEDEDHADVGWLAALSDPRLSGVLAAVHRDPAAPWSVHTLAAQARMSRSAFAAHFTAVTGETAMAYVTRWRIARATALLRDGRRTVRAVAAAVGYDSDAAFARAFRRVTGRTPAAYRRALADPV